MMHGLNLTVRAARWICNADGVPLSIDDLEMKKDRDEWLVSNMLTPTIFVIFNFWTNSLPFLARHVYSILAPLLVGYLVWVTLYENRYMVHIQPVFSMVFYNGQFLAVREKGMPFASDNQPG